MSIKENINQVKEDIKNYSDNPEKVKLLVVTKYVNEDIIKKVLEADHKYLGENRARVLRDKHDNLKDKEIKWDFIGNLQRNKVKYIIDYVNLIHSVDSLKLAKEINKRAKKADRNIDILLQVNLSGEDSKSGYTEDEIKKEIKKIQKLKKITIKGLMVMAPFADNENIIRKTFKDTRKLLDELNKNYSETELTELSMGMSNDYKIALEEGATILRIGSRILNN
ncbi:MAG: YggS family pyridoxal phosphate-dependent enzyme [Fusobacteriota bacterium]